MKKKLHVVHVISNLGVGGAEGVLFQLLSNLNTVDFKHTVVYFYDGPYVKKIKNLGIKTYRVQGAFGIYDPVFLVRFFFLIKKLKPDCLHTLLWAANFLGRLTASFLKIPHVEVLHNNIEQNGWIRLGLDRLTARHRGELVAVSQGVYESLEQYAPWFLYRPTQIIKNGIAHFPTTVQVKRQGLGLTENHLVIGSVGRFEPVKNYGLLLTAFALLYDDHRKVRLVLVGQGSQEEFLRRRAYDLGIDDRVIFVVGKDAKPYYDLFDIFVLTSPKEGISLALLEAMQAGVSSVVTSVVSKHDVIQDQKNGFVVPSGDPVTLAQRLDRLIKSRALRRKIGEEAKKRIASDFKIKTMVQEYKKLYEQVALRSFSVQNVQN